MSLDLRFLAPIYLALAYEIRTLGNYLPQKVFPAPEKQYFFQFSSNRFSKSAPLRVQKYPVYMFKRPFRFLC